MIDAWEMYSYFRSFEELNDENKMPTPELMKVIDTAYKMIISATWSETRKNFFTSLTLTDKSAGNSIYVPNDVESVFRVFRESATAAVFKECTEIDSEMSHLIDVSPSLIASDETPFYYRSGNLLTLYPVLPTSPSNRDVKFTYYKKIAPLIWGYLTTPGEFTDDFLTLDFMAPWFDDAFIGHLMVLYSKNATYKYWERECVLRASDYVASTRKVEFLEDDVIIKALSTATKYLYAFVPNIAEKYHQLIIDQARILLIDDGKLKGNLENQVKNLQGKLAGDGVGGSSNSNGVKDG